MHGWRVVSSATKKSRFGVAMAKVAFKEFSSLSAVQSQLVFYSARHSSSAAAHCLVRLRSVNRRWSRFAILVPWNIVVEKISGLRTSTTRKHKCSYVISLCSLFPVTILKNRLIQRIWSNKSGATGEAASLIEDLRRKSSSRISHSRPPA